jgi:pantoate--beta-alanine ligase
MMELIHTVEEMQARAEKQRCHGQLLALVPTMGALHEGHLALVRKARELADHVTVSVFVNPTQFGPDEDYERYPRDLEQDMETLERNIDGGVECIFAPSVDEMYPERGGPAVWTTVDRLDDHLCGRHRPGHFRGVTTVVSKLLLASRPHYGLFGKKDAQQYVILKRLIKALHFDTEIVGVPTQRAEDGLAFSSRNRYLTAEQRAQAVVLSQAVQRAEQLVKAGEQRPERIVKAMLEILEEAPEADVQYAELVDTNYLQPLDHITPGQEVLAAVAVYFGETRLIDNVFVEAPPAGFSS